MDQSEIQRGPKQKERKLARTLGEVGGPVNGSQKEPEVGTTLGEGDGEGGERVPRAGPRFFSLPS